MSVVDDIRGVTAAIAPFLDAAALLVDTVDPAAAIPLAALIAAIKAFNVQAPVVTVTQVDAKISDLESAEKVDDTDADFALTNKFPT